MGNRLLDLERDVRRARAQSLARQSSVRLPAGSRAFNAPVDYAVPGLVPVIAQPTAMTCWAAVTAILYSWRAQQSLPIETVLAQIGQRWLDLRNRPNVREQGLGAREKDQFLADAGLNAMYGQNMPVAEWERLLRTYGPLWVTTDEDPSGEYAIHARVMTGLHGDGTPAGTRADIVDPAHGGRRYTERFDVFLRKFEEEARNPRRPVRVQIVHFREPASQQRGLSLSDRSSAMGAVPAPGALAAWQHLISHRPPTAVQTSLKSRFTSVVTDAFHHLENGYGDINTDFYPVHVTTLPRVGGAPATAEQFLEHIRMNFNSFVDTSLANFEPYDLSVDAGMWRAGTLGATLHIDMRMGAPVGTSVANPDDGSVALTARSPHHWVFSTLWTPQDGGHPVSGNREFGFVANPSGGFTFYTRGADRPTSAADWALSSVVFGMADRLWKSLQEGIRNYTVSNGGAATIGTRVWDRWDWPAVQRDYHRPSVSWI